MDIKANDEKVADYESLPGQDLLNLLNKRAPLSTEKVETLVKNGWREFYSYHEFRPNGAADADQLRLALKALEKEITPSLRTDYEVCRAQYESVLTQKDNVFALLKKKTQERNSWENQK